MLRAVVFDWCGTMVDFGSCAPVSPLVELYARHRIAVSAAEARLDMGLPKWEHIEALGHQPRIAAAWLEAHGRHFGTADVDRLYRELTPMLAAAARRHAELVPGAAALVEALRAVGLKIGSTTGCNARIMDVLAPLAAAQGYAPDSLVCAGDLGAGRPTPLMMYRAFMDLRVWPPHTVVKVDDTAPGLAEGLAAGCWTVGVSVSGNAVGLARDAWLALGTHEQATLRDLAEHRLRAAGAHEVVDTVADLLPALDRIRARLARGERPA